MPPVLKVNHIVGWGLEVTGIVMDRFLLKTDHFREAQAR